MMEKDYRRMYTGPFLTTDLIIEYKNKEKEGIVLITRKNFPFGIALPGGFAEKGLTLEENAKKEGKEETNLEIFVENPEYPFTVHSDPKRDPRDHMVAVVYVVKGEGELKGGDDAKTASLYSVDEIIELLKKKDCFAFDDHRRMLMKYLKFRGHLK